MLSCEPGCTIAKPPETVIEYGQQTMLAIMRTPSCSVALRSVEYSALVSVARRTEELFAPSTFLDDFDKPWLQLLDRWNVVCEDTHLSGLGGDIDLDATVPPGSA